MPFAIQTSDKISISEPLLWLRYTSKFSDDCLKMVNQRTFFVAFEGDETRPSVCVCCIEVGTNSRNVFKSSNRIRWAKNETKYFGILLKSPLGVGHYLIKQDISSRDNIY